jgi:hypothetical protein
MIMNGNSTFGLKQPFAQALSIVIIFSVLAIVNCSGNNPVTNNQPGNGNNIDNDSPNTNTNDNDLDESIPVPSKYTGTATITVVYGLSSNGTPFATKNYTHQVDVFIKNPKQISLTGIKEANDLNLEFRSLPDAVSNKYAGSFYICSATTAAPGASPNLSGNMLFQFWDLQVDGTSIEGTIKNTYKNYNPVVFANFFTIETVAGTPRYLSRFLESISKLSGTVTAEDADFEIIGGVEGGSPDYVCVFKISISASRV